MHELSFITVVFGDELPLLKLQARSFSLFAPSHLVREILIGVNDARDARVKARIEAEVLPLYGDLASKVRVLCGDEILIWGKNRRGVKDWWRKTRIMNPFLRRKKYSGGWRGNRGWLVQQIMKLALVQYVSSEYTVILDAKNIWLKNIDFNDFVSDDGLPLSNFIDAQGHKVQEWMPPSLRAVRAERDLETIDEITAYVTPFVCKSTLLRDVCAFLAKHHGSVQEAFFFSDPSPTEFCCLNAYILERHDSVRAVFAEGLLPHGITVRRTSEEQVDSILGQARRGELKCIGLHRVLVARLTDSHLAEIEALFTDIGIISSPGVMFDVRMQLRAVA